MIHWFFLHNHQLYKLFYFFYKRISDRQYISWINKNLKKGMVAVDIGANIGFYSILFSDIVGNKGKVYAFEPEKNNFHFLKNNIKRHGNILLQNLAVSDKNGISNLYISKDFNVDHRSYPTGETRKIKKIKSVKLDSFFSSKIIIDLIKIDIQGFDFFAIKGAQKLIRRQKHIAIIGEFWPYGLQKAGVKPQDYINLLKKLQLKVIIESEKSFDKQVENKNYYTNFIAFK